MSDPIQRPTFDAAVGKTVTLTHGGVSHEMTLVKCEGVDTSKDAPDAAQARPRKPFNLLLRAEPGTELRSDVYTLSGPGIDAIEGVLVTRVEARPEAEATAQQAESAPHFEICFN